MHHIVLLALLVSAALTVAGIVAATTQGLTAWRAFRRFQTTAGAAMAETAERMARLEARAAGAPARAARVEAAQRRLQVSVAEASVIFAALTEAMSLIDKITDVLPRK
jgi:hypothetical protein